MKKTEKTETVEERAAKILAFEDYVATLLGEKIVAVAYVSETGEGVYTRVDAGYEDMVLNKIRVIITDIRNAKRQRETVAQVKPSPEMIQQNAIVQQVLRSLVKQMAGMSVSEIRELLKSINKDDEEGDDGKAEGGAQGEE
jgi:regulator of PEP synthase PpsR (kinase-PPPase family)